MKGKWQERKRHGSGKSLDAAGGHREAVAVRAIGAGRRERARMPRIVRAARQTIKPMSVSDAAKEIDIAREGVVVFRDPATAAINVLYRRRDGGYGLIGWKQDIGFGRRSSVSFGNPDFVQLAESFGAKGYAIGHSSELLPTLRKALDDEAVSVIACPVDYGENARLVERLGALEGPI